MASPHSPYSHQVPGPSSYYSQSPPAPVYGNHSPGPYQYSGPYPMQHHHQGQPSPSPMSGRGGGPYPPWKGGHAYSNQHYNQLYPPQQQHPTPQPAKPRPQPYPPSYANATTFVPSWQSHQQISPLPKQLSIPPPSAPTNIPFETPEVPPPAQSSSSYAQMGTIQTEPSPTNQDSPLLEKPASPSPPPQPSQSQPKTNPLGGWAIWSRRPHDPAHAPGIIISPRARPPPDVVDKALGVRTPPPSPPASVKDLPVIDADQAAQLSSEESNLIQEPPHLSPEAPETQLDAAAVGMTPPTVPSSSTTETTDTDTDTPTLPGSPISTNTSVSASVVGTPAKNTETTREAIDSVPPPQDSQPSQPQPPPVPAPPPQKKSWASLLHPVPSSSSSPASTTIQRNTLPMSSVVGISIPASSTFPPAGAAAITGGAQVPQGKKKELLTLLTPGHTTATTSPAVSFSSAAAASPAAKTQKASQIHIRPRGLVNSGNMCFANAVLQILVYCSPFHRLFHDLGQVLGDGGGTALLGGAVRFGPEVGGKDDKERKEGTPLVDATIEFLKEFTHRRGTDSKSHSRTRGGSVLTNGGRKGKGKEMEERGRSERDAREDDWDGESFIPTNVYDAMKEKKRFDNMRGGQQEDAEEFLGFYLDTLEEELLSVVDSLLPAPSDKSTNKTTPNKNSSVEETLEQEPTEDGWLEVGRRNRMVVTRTIKGAESPITRIFGGKFRSTLRAPQQKDSVIVEDWRALRLDIQRDHIHTIQDALAHISDPQSVQVTNPSRPGVTVDASQQVLIDALPHILVLHMKRFCYDTSVKGVVKVGKQVRFGAELEVGPDVMAPSMRRGHPTRYKLFGVLYHHGLSASGGHYTLDVLHPNRYPSVDPNAKPREGWVRIDDELVSDVRPEDVFGASEREDEARCAYLLFYQRVR